MPVTYANLAEARSDVKNPAPIYANGYGPKQPTRFWVKLVGDAPTARWRRVYCAQYGNSGSLYVVVKGDDLYIRDTDLEAAMPAFFVA